MMNSFMKKGLSVVVALGITATMIVPSGGLFASADSGSPAALPVTLSKTATALTGTTNEWTINLSASGQSTTKTTTSDIVLVLDRSGSMGQSIQAVKDSAKALVDTVLTNNPYTRVALVSFSDSATSINNCALTSYTDIDKLKTKITALTAGGGTNMQDGIFQAEQILAGSQATNKDIILLSDGEPTYSFKGTAASNYSGWVAQSGVTTHNFKITAFDRTSVMGYGNSYTFNGYGIGYHAAYWDIIPPFHHSEYYDYTVSDNGIGTMSEALIAKGAGATVFSIGYNLGNDDTAKYVLKNIASDTSKYYEASSTNVSSAFASIAGNIQSFYSATASSVTDPIGDKFDFVSGSIVTSAGTTASYDPVTRTITWQTGTIAGASPATLSYRVSLKTGAPDSLWPTNGTTTLHYTDSTGKVTSKDFDVPQAGVMTVPVNYVDKAGGAVLATESVKAQIGTAYTVPSKSIDGYTYDSTNDPNNGVIPKQTPGTVTVYYNKGNYGYQIQYYKDGAPLGNPVDGGTATFGSTTTITADSQVAIAQLPTGYVVDASKGLSVTINSTNKTQNILNVYYVKGTYGYVIQYYKDGAPLGTPVDGGTATFGSTATITADSQVATAQLPTGYVVDASKGLSVTINSTNKTQNILNVYYVKGTYGYVIQYYKDGAPLGNPVDGGTATFGSTAIITADSALATAQLPAGYIVDTSKGLSVTINSTNKTQNILNVYYVEGTYNYQIQYYKDGAKLGNPVDGGSAQFGSTVTIAANSTAAAAQLPTGYVVDASKGLSVTISSTEKAQNILNVYYVKGSYGYTVRYLEAGTNKVLMPETTGTAVFGSPVTASAKSIDGYTPDAATKTLASMGTEGNVITFYYGVNIPDTPTPESAATTITVHYYLKDTTTSVADDFSDIGIVGKSKTETAKTIDGYTLVSDSSITINSLAQTSNVITFYYTKNSTPATVTIPDNTTPLAANPKTSDNGTQIPFYAALASLFTVFGVGIEKKARKARKHS